MQDGRLAGNSRSPPPEPWIFEGFPRAVPEDLLLKYISVLFHYQDFQPRPSWSDLRNWAIDAVLRFGSKEDNIAYELALLLRDDLVPEATAGFAMRRLSREALQRPHEEAIALKIILGLLISEQTRPRVVEELADWFREGRHPQLVRQLLGSLNPAERALIGQNARNIRI